MREVRYVQHAEDERQAKGRDRVESAGRDAVQQLEKQEFQGIASMEWSPMPRSWGIARW